MTRYGTVIALALSLSLLTGCAFFRGHWGEEFSPEDVAAIKKGTTTRAEIADRFGAPEEIVHAAERDIFHYRRYDSKLGYLVIFSRFNIMGDHLYVFFNREGVVDEVVFGKRTDRLKFQIWPFGE